MPHIPPHLLLPQDLVMITDKDHEGGPRTFPMHATDARHAMDVEPDRYELFDPQPAGPELVVDNTKSAKAGPEPTGTETETEFEADDTDGA